MKGGLNNISDETWERIQQWERELGESLQSTYNESDIVLLGRRVEVVRPDGQKIYVDFLDIDEEVMVVQTTIRFRSEGNLEYDEDAFNVSLDIQGIDLVKRNIAKAYFEQGCDELERIFDEGMTPANRKWKLDIAHDRFVTAEHVLDEAVEALGDLCEGGVIDAEMHDEVYDLHKQVRRIKRILGTVHRWPNGATVYHDISLNGADLDEIEGLRDVVGDTDKLTVEYRFLIQGSDVSLDRIESVYRFDDEGYTPLGDGTKHQLRRLSVFTERLKTCALQSLAE